MEIFIGLLPLILLVGIFVLLIIKYRKEIYVPPVIPQEGINVPLINAYRGTWLFNIHNGLYPKLRLFEDRFEYTIFGSASRRFDEIAGIGLGMTGVVFTNDLEIRFNNSRWAFHADMSKHNLKEVLKFFQSKGCNLTPSAESFLSQPS